MQEKEKLLIKLSNKKNILQLITENEKSIFKDKTNYFINNVKKSWYILNENIQCKNNSIRSLYFAIISPYLEICNISLNTFSDLLINKKKVLESVENYYGKQISILSDEIIKCSINKYANMIDYREDNITLIEEKFIHNLKTDIKMYESIFNNFSYWTTSIYNFLENTTNYITKVLINLSKEYLEIKEELYGQDFLVENIELEVGDRHKDKFVLKLKTSMGDLYYKPRNNDIEIKLKKIIDLVKFYSDEILDIKFPLAYCRDEHQWVKSVNFKPLEKKSEEEKYYRRLGQILGLYYIIDGNDLHFENVISDGEYPILIDTETIFTSRMLLKRKNNSSFLSNDENNYGIISVKDIGIIPHFVKIGKESIDISCINLLNNKGDMEYYKSFNIEKSKLHVVGQYITLEEIENQVIRGFASIYRIFEKYKQELIDTIYEMVKDLKVRFIKNPTNDYSKIMKSMMKPICFYDFSYAFAISSRIYSGSEKPDTIELYEQKDLISLNIPFLEVYVDSKVILYDQDKIIENYFIESPWEVVKNKIMYLNEIDYSNQIEIIRMMFKSSKGLGLKEVKDYIEHTTNKEIEKSSLELEYKLIIEEIIKKSHKNPITGEQFWVGYQLLGEEYQVMNLPNTYYSGIIGMISILSKNNKYVDCYFFKNAVSEFLKELPNKVQIMDDHVLTGAYEGIGMYIKVLNDLFNNKILEEEYYIEYINLILEKCKKAIVNDKKYDVLYGNSGLILSLLGILDSMEEKEITQKVKSMLMLIIKELQDNITIKNGRYYFLVDGATDTYFTGYAHGSSGIITALYKGMKALNIMDESLIKRLLHTERALYDRNKGVWYKDNRKESYSWGWCHGIPGILLSRIELWKNGYRDEIIESEIHELIDLSIKKGLGYNTTLCHGDIGTITIVKYAYDILTLPSDDNIEYLLNYEKSFVNEILLKRHSINVRGFEGIGLMDGLLGIAYYIFCIKNGILPIEALTL